MANVLPREKRLRVLAALVDGNSERAVERMTGVNRLTIGRLALALGIGATNLHNRLARDLSCSMIQCDEIWSYVGKKEARVTDEERAAGLGEAYTYVALDESSRFVITWHVGKRDQENANAFVADVRARLVVMPMMSTDGFQPYVSAVGASFGPSIDYGQMVKNYRSAGRRDDHRYEPPRDPFITKKAIYGAPDMDKVSTAYVERNNATMRHHIGRMRRLVYAFSKDIEHHKSAVALAYVHYNLCHVVRTLRVTPAMAAGVTDHVWSLDELLDALLSSPPCAPPEAKPLAPRQPETPARQLPAGRGFLRLVAGGAAPVAPPPAPPAPVAPAAAATRSPAAPAAPVAPPPAPAAPPPTNPGQLSLFDDPPPGA